MTLPVRLAGIVAKLSAAIPAPPRPEPKPRKRWGTLTLGQRYKLGRDLALLHRPASQQVGVQLPPVHLPWGSILEVVECDTEGVTLEVVPPCPPDTSPEDQGLWLDTFRTARRFRWTEPASGLFTPLKKPRAAPKKKVTGSRNTT